MNHPVDNPVVEMSYRMILPNHRMPSCNPVFVSQDANHTDTQDNYVGYSYDTAIAPILNQCKGSQERGGTSKCKGGHLCVLAFNRVDVVAVTTILVLHVCAIFLAICSMRACERSEGPCIPSGVRAAAGFGGQHPPF